MNWLAKLNADPLPWLLEPDPANPGVRYFTLRDLLDRHPGFPKAVYGFDITLNQWRRLGETARLHPDPRRRGDVRTAHEHEPDPAGGDAHRRLVPVLDLGRDPGVCAQIALGLSLRSGRLHGAKRLAWEVML